MGPDQPLPLPAEWEQSAGGGGAEAFVESLLRFGTTSTTLRTLCGGVHILDFLTREPDLYSLVLPAGWRDYFARDDVDVAAVLDLLMRRDLGELRSPSSGGGDGDGPPEDLLAFIADVRRHSLRRGWAPPRQVGRLPRHVALGMGVKKQHEVQHFAAYVDGLAARVAAERGPGQAVSHIADFGSGQNYLGRALASPPYGRRVVGIESRSHNIEGARGIDVLAGLAPKKVVLRNKKEWRRENPKDRPRKGGEGECEDCGDGGAAEVEVNGANGAGVEEVREEQSPEEQTTALDTTSQATPDRKGQRAEDAFAGFAPEGTADFVQESTKETFNGIPKGSKKAKLHLLEEGGGSIQYIEHRLEDGNLDHVVQQILDPAKVAEQQEQDTQTKERADQPFLTSTPAVTSTTRAQDPNLMVISLHSCGNLVHHGLRSLVLNPSVKAVAMIGCCYNLMTERLGPPSYKLPQLRPNHPRLEATSNAFDPHGFPMSARYATYPIPETDGSEVGVRLNITARMMAVQAPQNWGAADSEAFFTRHFFRALLQRVFLDRGVVGPPRSNGAANLDAEMRQGRTVGPCSPAGCSSGGEPVVIGSLKKSCYADFVAYVRGALAKIEANAEQPARAEQVRRLMGDITDEEIRGYEETYGRKKKELSVVWSLMAFAAGVVEAMIVVDRWLWLGEQEGIEKAWVEPVFDYAMSPRNLVVVGLKK
ncbi:hypothetical protein SLS56_001486 [Neofusicoccum ribis]|uniref:Methyltransferase domain-containing protein n=1 Tax=Neofusicoccum ribis TaxID=45134 RepID=A0ABR3T961_9PEZI